MINLLLWLSMLFLIFRIQEYSTHRGRYLVTGVAIFFIPLLLFSFFLTSPYPSEIRRRRADIAAEKHSQYADCIRAGPSTDTENKQRITYLQLMSPTPPAALL